MDHITDCTQIIGHLINILCHCKIGHYPVQRISQDHKTCQHSNSHKNFYPGPSKSGHKSDSIVGNRWDHRKNPDEPVIFILKLRLCDKIFYNQRIIYCQQQKYCIADKYPGLSFSPPDQCADQSHSKQKRIPAGTPVQLHTCINKAQSQFLNCYTCHFFLLSVL